MLFRSPRDLESICLRCLEKEPRRRYASAEALADDLRRFLAGEPILARAVSTRERVWKWVRRRPLVASLLALLVGVTAIGFGLVTWKWREADAHAAAERQARKESEQRETRLALDRGLTLCEKRSEERRVGKECRL